MRRNPSLRAAQPLPEVDVEASEKLVISVMAGVGIDEIRRRTQARRIVRAMSSPAADLALAYSPWYSLDNLSEADRNVVRTVFCACGVTDQVDDEDQIDLFTALTGPVPGLVAYYADCMVAYAAKHGVAADIAVRAIRQLFHASGVILASSPAAPAEHVRSMIDYAGTTAAGLEAMRRSPLSAAIESGLDAAYQRARTIGG
jgi:pyrroline-5-carboxylate reductase